MGRSACFYCEQSSYLETELLEINRERERERDTQRERHRERSFEGARKGRSHFLVF